MRCWCVDEVQSGIGRTGEWFAFPREGVRARRLTLAKGLGGGLPIGACLGLGAAGGPSRRGDHGSTFGGNPVSCAAALAVLAPSSGTSLLANVTDVGAQLAHALEGLQHALVTGVRGSGLWLALALGAPVRPRSRPPRARDPGQRGAAGCRPARSALILTAGQAASFLAALPAILDAASVLAGQEA